MSEGYSARDIQVLEGRDHVRKRPAMYIGGVGREGLHHLLWEIVDNSVDEAMNGFATTITVVLHADGSSATVIDNGRGIPTDIHPAHGKSALEVILTTLYAGGKFDNKSYETAGGLHGVGASVVNFLSSQLIATVKRPDGTWVQRFRKGRATADAVLTGEARGTGTSIFFRPDPSVFPEVRFDGDVIARRLDIKAYLNGGLRIVFRDELAKTTATFVHEGGVADLVESLVKDKGWTPVVPQSFILRHEEPGFRLELAICWTTAPREAVGSYVNTIPTPDGGTHVRGFRDALTRAVRTYIDTHELLPRGITLGAEDIREGVVGVVSTFVSDPQFQGQTKDRLNNPGVRAQVEGVVRPKLEEWLHANGSMADAIVSRVIQSARARAASRSAANQVRRKAAVSHRLNLPGKLADCSSTDPDNSEIFIVEGDSAGGSAKQGRDRHTQAVLPLRGKVLNAEQASSKKVLANKELGDVVKALGCGLGRDFDISRLRYGRVILLMDADSDGHHITTLLMTFIYKYLPELIIRGHIYIAQPPLYRVNAGKETYWASSDAHRDAILARLPRNVKPEMTRFKGLGEMMPKTLFSTTMDPARRTLLKVRIPPGEWWETAGVMSDLMGKDVSRRFEMIMAGATQVEALDV